MFEPMKVTAYLQCPVISDAYLPIDGILHYQANRDVNGVQEITLPGEDYHPKGTKQTHMWLKVVNGGTPQWHYAASFAQWEGAVAEGQDHWNKRFDQSLAHLIDFQGRRGKVIVEQGAYKAYHMPVWYRHALEVTWYLVGDLGWVQRMLSTVTHLGKKTAQGWGAVLRWEVEPWPHDWSVWGPASQLMRAVPSDKGIRIGLRPSYWLPRNQMICEVPE